MEAINVWKECKSSIDTKKSNESEINPENSGKHAMHYEKFR